MAFDSLLQRPLRSILTSLGIIFGVAAVIAMMAIGSGAQAEIIEQMKILGANNIIIEPIVEQEEGDVTEEGGSDQPRRYSPGLMVKDAESILKVIPNVVSVSPEIVLESTFLRAGKKRSGKLVGVTNAFFKNTGSEIARGRIFGKAHQELASPVCVIGFDIKTKFFSQENPIGKRIKVGKNWLTVIGVAAERPFSKSSMRELGIRDYDTDIYVPINTVLLRYKNRAKVSPSDLRKATMQMHGNNDDEEKSKIPKNYHQVDRLLVTVAEGTDMYKTADVIRRMLERRHNQVVDTEVMIPEELLAQKQRTTDIFNYVLISIAAISLLIGGIGIMNIMLASVMERIKEIGVRLSLGATKRDIVTQFLGEAIALSVAGGLMGILVGVLLSIVIEKLSDIQTIISGFSVLLSFFVAASVGVFFGFFPARKAAKQDPVVSLRHE